MKALLRSMAAITTLLAFHPAVLAEEYPTRALRIIVPYSPGGVPDVVARLLASKLGEGLGQPVVVENKPGAKGAIAAGAMTALPADGYTLLVTDSAMLTINPQLTVKPAYDAKKDFSLVSLIAQAPMYLAVSSKSPMRTLDELVSYSRAKPGGISYGSSGSGSIHQLATEAMRSGLGIEMNHIPYRGASNSLQALIAGEIDVTFVGYSTAQGFVKSGRARLLGISTAKRSSLTPDIEPIANKVPGFDYAFTIGMLAKVGTPQNAVRRLSDEISKIAKQPAFNAQLREIGIVAVGGTPGDFEKELNRESLNVTMAIKSANLMPE